MEVTEDALAKIKKQLLTCPICDKIYQEPKGLPACLHTFCAECLSSFIQLESLKFRNGIYDIQCPVWKACVKIPDPFQKSSLWAAQLKTNFYVQNLIEAFLPAENKYDSKTEVSGTKVNILSSYLSHQQQQDKQESLQTNERSEEQTSPSNGDLRRTSPSGKQVKQPVGQDYSRVKSNNGFTFVPVPFSYARYPPIQVTSEDHSSTAHGADGFSQQHDYLASYPVRCGRAHKNHPVQSKTNGSAQLRATVVQNPASTITGGANEQNSQIAFLQSDNPDQLKNRGGSSPASHSGSIQSGGLGYNMRHVQCGASQQPALKALVTDLSHNATLKSERNKTFSYQRERYQIPAERNVRGTDANNGRIVTQRQIATTDGEHRPVVPTSSHYETSV